MDGEGNSRFEEWMRRAQDGDSGAYQHLLTELSRLLKGYVAKRFRVVDDTDEIVQEILLAIHQSRHTYDPLKPFLPWAHAIARYRLIDHLRRWSRTRSKEVDVADHLETLASEEVFAPETGVSARLTDALKTLSPQQRETVELLKIKGLSVKEAAEKLGLSESAVKVTAHRGYKKLKKHFGVDVSGNP